jgi:UDP-N-acetyl-D-mannosaminuronate dehydrogenase
MPTQISLAADENDLKAPETVPQEEPMSDKKTVLVIGLGEVGKPLLSILSQSYEAVGIDIQDPAERIERANVMHICYPFEIRDFVGETVRYIARYRPELTIINSTVAVGTTRKIAALAGTDVVHSPVRGKHAHMRDEMLHYTKFIGAQYRAAAQKAANHFESSGFKTKVLSSPEATELGKLTETTYFGILIAWAQEVERYCEQTGTDYNEVVSLYDEVGFFPPVRYFPGIIGGHCVMRNIQILSQLERSPLLRAIQDSNEKKTRHEARAQVGANEASALAAVPKE